MQFMLSKFEIKINKKKLLNIEKSIDKILSSEAFYKLDNINPFLSTLGHFNFHGENIIVKNMSNFDNFKLIDPDPRWKIQDPFFSMARFYYTLDHDTNEKNQYHIYSNLFNKTKNTKSLEFNIKYLWDKKTINAYKLIFDKQQYENTLDDLSKFRFNISYLLCLLRGINANYEEKIAFITKDLKIFQNSGIFFSLNLIKYADYLASKLTKL